MAGLTEKTYWDNSYEARGCLEPVQTSGYKNYCYLKILDVISKIGLQKKNVLEIGGGGSGWIARLAIEYPESTFTALDYSDAGCKFLEDFSRENDLKNIKVICDDFFNVRQCEGKYDLVYSQGVVEHFENLPDVMKAFKGFLGTDGRMVTIIPNMSGLNGWLTKLFNKAVFDIHVPHTKESFKAGHVAAGLEIIEYGYLCSNNFGVLSSCFADQSGVKFFLYKQLTRVSKVVWWFESKFFAFPAGRLFSPYIYAVAKKGE